ncbi:MAG: hypothetical protein OXH52_00405 [Gammaproteobacteria bacterium]|nr:hypothetical protein [Gammaproteobacteria bacterium]
MRIEIAGWESEGLRCPDVSVDLRRDGRVPRVSLVQMPNGTGKTTTLELLNAALSGSAQGWRPEQVRAYRRGREGSVGRFKANLLADGKPLSIELMLDYSTGQASYRSTSPGSGGVVQVYRVPPSLDRFFRPEFLRLFIFDGEFAGRLLDGGQAEADRVVDALCQVYLLTDAASFARDYWERESRAADTTRTEAGLGRLRERRNGLSVREARFAGELEGAKAEIGALGKAAGELREKIRQRIDSVAETRGQRDEAESERAAARSEVAERRANLMTALRLPHAIHPDLADRLVELRDNLDRVRLPENTSAQFFEELVEEDDCICGRPMDVAASEQIRARAKRYLDADDSGIINALKQDISRYTEEPEDAEEDAGHARVLRLRAELTEAVRRERLADQRFRVLMDRLIEAGDKELEAWQAEVEEKEERAKECQRLVDEIEGLGVGDPRAETSKSLRVIRREIGKLNDRIAQIEGSVRLRRQTELIASLLDEAGERARATIKAELLEECNTRLSVILENDPLTIDRIDRSIRLRGQRGASAGQTLAIGYTFLMSVLNRGQNDFPLVVDSPAGPIDKGVRRRVGRLLPTLCSQFLGFTINTEREGFVDALESRVDDIAYLTLFRKTPGTQRMMEALPDNRYAETRNAVLVDDRDYFFGFDIEEEEENAVQAS